MASKIAPARWVRPVVAGLLAAAVLLSIRLAGNNSPTISGGLVYVGVILLIGFVFIGRRVERVTRTHHLVFYLVPVAVLLTLVAIDVGYVRENGITVSTTAIVVLIVAVLVRR